MKAYPHTFVMVFWWVLVLLFISGLLLLPGMLELRLEWEIPAALHFGSRVVLAALHGLFAFATVAVLGALVPLHIRSGWRRRKHVRSGIAVLSLMLALALTGWGIYYLADERWAVSTSVAHVLIGLGVVVLLTLHVVIAKRAHAAHVASHLLSVVQQQSAEARRHSLVPATKKRRRA